MELITALLVVVHTENAGDINIAYVVVNALILALGIGLNRLGSTLGRRRSAAPVVT